MPIAESPYNLKRVRQSRSERVAEHLRDQILTGKYAPHSLLPGRRALAKTYDVSLPTAEQAIKSLVEEGLVRAEPGRGTFIADLAGEEIGHSEQQDIATAVIGIVADTRARVSGSHFVNHITNTILDAFEAAVSAAGGTTRIVDLSQVDNSMRPGDEISRDLNASRLDALAVFCNHTRQLEEYLADDRLREATSVIIGSNTELRVPGCVYYDSFEASYNAARHLISRGCSRLLFFSPFTTEWTIGRLNGARQAVAQSTGEASINDFVDPVDGTQLMKIVQSDHNEFQRELASVHAERLLDSGVEFDGIVASNDRAAYGLIAAFAKRGLEPGKDFRIIGFDDAPDSRRLGLSTMRPPLEEMGAQAAHIAIDCLHGRAPRRVCFPSRVVARRSTSVSTKENEDEP